MKKAMLTALALLTVLALPAAAQRTCLRTGDIRNWTAIGNRTLIVEDTWRNKFRLSLIGNCSNMRFNDRLAFQSRGSTRLSCLSAGDSIIQRDFARGRSRCAITRIEAYTPEMEQADRAAGLWPGRNRR